MSLKNSQNMNIIPIYSIDDSIFFKNQFSHIGVGNFGNDSSTKRIVRQGFCVVDDLVDKLPRSVGTVLRDEILNLEQS